MRRATFMSNELRLVKENAEAEKKTNVVETSNVIQIELSWSDYAAVKCSQAVKKNCCR